MNESCAEGSCGATSCEKTVTASGDADLFFKIATECQKIAKFFGDRQSADSTLTGRQCTALVNALLNAGNLLDRAAQRSTGGL